MKSIQIGNPTYIDDLQITPLELIESGSYGNNDSYFISGKKQIYALLFFNSDKIFALDLKGNSVDIEFLSQTIEGLPDYLKNN